jgi:hypothetical protein
MTERTPIRFSVYSKTTIAVSNFAPLRYDLINFDFTGNYDTSTYRYTISATGTYLIGYTYVKFNTSPARCNLIVVRNNINLILATTLNPNAVVLGSTINNCGVYQLQVGDIIYVQSRLGNPRVNLTAYTTDDILNSFWGIRLDYDYVS